MDTAAIPSPSPSPAEPPVRCTVRGAVLQIELNRPAERNPLGADTVEALTDGLARADSDPAIRVVLFTGAGEAFSAGGNLGNLAERLQEPPGADGRDPIARGNRSYGEFLQQLQRSPKTTVASVRGAAMGGGAGLVCAVDIAIGAAGAKFGFPEASIGLVPGQILPFVAARIGVQAARRLMLTGERIDAAEAHRIGLLDYLVADAADLPARTEAVIASIVGCAPRASAHTKQLLRSILGQEAWEAEGLVRYLDGASELFARQMRSEAIEGVAASRARRKPDWSAA